MEIDTLGIIHAGGKRAGIPVSANHADLAVAGLVEFADFGNVDFAVLRHRYRFRHLVAGGFSAVCIGATLHAQGNE